MRPAGLHHVSINVRDVTESVSFYTRLLGLTQLERPALRSTGAWLSAGGQQVHLIQDEVPAPLGQHFALAVPDLDAAVSELRAGGVEVSEPAGIGAGRQAFLADPDGNRVELHQPG